MPNWDEDSLRLRQNLEGILTTIVRTARKRGVPSRQLARQWQIDFMAGLVPDRQAYVGAYRGERGLENVGVMIGGFPGTPPVDVNKELTRFETSLADMVAELDTVIPVDQLPTPTKLRRVIRACAWAHAEWVRMHPFANGNGRTARLWANWIAVRYGLPPFVQLRPRPGKGYERAGAQAMQGKWKPTIKVFEVLLDALLAPPPPKRRWWLN